MQLKYDLYTPNFVNDHLASVVLLHSMCETKKTWMKIAPDIAKMHRKKTTFKRLITNKRNLHQQTYIISYIEVYAIDARNHGESPWCDKYTMDALVEDLEEFLHQHKITKPEMIEKLIIEDSTPKNFISGGGKHVTIGLNLAKEIHNLMPSGMAKKETEDFIRDFLKPFVEDLRVPEEIIMTYDFDLLPLKWDGNTFNIDLNIDVIADAMINNKLQQNLSGTFDKPVLLIYGSNSHFKSEQTPCVLKILSTNNQS
ncbi:protein ABHD11 [Caerostris extrusa]|uniref:Protein ABHD11 n=1 Tax=Caerostris extrusa TaxID=172846 RepID=A0AAV4MP20_CAEEX|nr:protein ABHD11 [Caerostris extrusa]